MRLIIDNLAKIGHADILIDGLTVIAGENNTGKSTVGKVLYSVFNSMYNMDEKIETEKREEIERACRNILRTLRIQGKLPGSQAVVSISRKLGVAIYEHLSSYEANELTYDLLGEIFCDEFNQYGIELYESLQREDFSETFSKIMERQRGDDHKASLELISRFFRSVFASQIASLNNVDENPKVRLRIKDQDLVLRFENNECVALESEFNILHEAFFIDDPFIVDDASHAYFPGIMSEEKIRDRLKERLQRPGNTLTEGIFDAVVAKEGLREIFAILNEVAGGDIITKNGDWRLRSEKLTDSLLLDNLSAGVKSFLIVRMLLESGNLREKDVLILDEPEIHLHPDWQLKYAEIIVLLQKQFDLSIVVTTHSRDFLEAIELYSRKYKIEEKCNYYRSSEKNGAVSFENVTGNLEKIYAQMVTASMLLDRLRYGMEEEDE
ncbi:MAG: ATP-binding protein [Lachnospiraceae bacterium]|nr:ATP-binding protein [Lachnospiraceae bacterium]